MSRALRLALAAGCALLGLSAPPVRADDPQAFERIERGRYLAIVGDCQGCHTAPGGTPFAGGRPLETPFGTLVSPNLTPDPETGLGRWTDAQFERALRDGIGRDGEHLYPGMPYAYFTRATPEDVAAIRAYLRTLDPVRKAVEPNQLPFPFDIRLGMAAWNALYVTPGVFQPHPDRDATWNRGAYLVEGLGHCGACHTPKTLLGGDEQDRALQGGVLQGWTAPGITGDRRTGIGAWSDDEIVEYLQTGRNARAAASGMMAEVVALSTSHMTAADLRAIARYLRDMPGPPGDAPAPLAADDARMRQGGAIYLDQCSACHTPAGAGIARLFPALHAGAQVQAEDPTTLIRIVLEGSRSVATDAAPVASAMPGFGWKLDDDQVAAVVTYIRNAWGNAAAPISAGDVAALRKRLQGG